MAKRMPAQNRKVVDSAMDGLDEFVETVSSRDEAISTLLSTMFLKMFHELEHEKEPGRTLDQLLQIGYRLGELERRNLIHSSTLKRLEADVNVLKGEEGGIEEEIRWPAYASEDFEKIVENTRGLESAGNDKSQILYHIMEIETFLGKVEEKARVTNRKYEARMAASLRDICRVHEPSEISEEQIKRFTACVRTLIEGWGKLNREKVNWIRSRLLEVGLTWLPVTQKARKDIAEVKSLQE